MTFEYNVEWKCVNLNYMLGGIVCIFYYNAERKCVYFRVHGLLEVC